MADMQIGTAAPASGLSTPVSPAASAAPDSGGGQLALELSAADSRAASGIKDPTTPAVPGALPKHDAIKSAVGEANHALAASGTQMVFVFDDHAHHMSVKLLDVQTQKVVQEMQPRALIKAAQALSGSSTSGALVDTTA